MSNSHARHNLGEVCPQCEVVHLTRSNKPACVAHVTTDRDSYVPGQQRKPLPEPRSCRNPPTTGHDVCEQHGAAAPHAKQAVAERVAEENALKQLAKLGDAGDPITDPIATLCAIAGRAVKFMESLGERVDELTEIRATDRTGAEQLRAEVAVYARSIRDAGAIVEGIVRQGIAERFAKQNAQVTASIVEFIDAVITDLGLNPRDPEVASIIVRRLGAVA